jgi:hypothetical protein
VARGWQWFGGEAAASAASSWRGGGQAVLERDVAPNIRLIVLYSPCYIFIGMPCATLGRGCVGADSLTVRGGDAKKTLKLWTSYPGGTPNRSGQTSRSGVVLDSFTYVTTHFSTSQRSQNSRHVEC